jgi:hypothetical protein
LAVAFLGLRISRPLLSCFEPMQKVARILRPYEELIASWFRTEGEVSNAAVGAPSKTIRVIPKQLIAATVGAEWEHL